MAGLTDLSQMQVDVILGAPAGTTPIDTERVAAAFPHGKVNVAVEPGGLLAPGGGADPADQILMVNAVLYVRVE